jgi:hypothetical protein
VAPLGTGTLEDGFLVFLVVVFFFLIGAGTPELGGEVGCDGVVGVFGIVPEAVPPPPLLVVPELPELELPEPEVGGVTGVLGGLLVLMGVVTGGVTGVLGPLPDELPPPDELPDPLEDPLLPPLVMNCGPAKVLAGGAGASLTLGLKSLAADPLPMIALGLGPGS